MREAESSAIDQEKGAIHTARLNRDLDRAFAVENPNELIRTGAWKGLIWLRFGDEVAEYDETSAPLHEPLNWASAIRMQVDTIERLTSYSLDAYSILNQ